MYCNPPRRVGHTFFEGSYFALYTPILSGGGEQEWGYKTFVFIVKIKLVGGEKERSQKRNSGGFWLRAEVFRSRTRCIRARVPSCLICGEKVSVILLHFGFRTQLPSFFVYLLEDWLRLMFADFFRRGWGRGQAIKNNPNIFGRF